ncbi:MAG TPA: hypothetical protein VJO15_03895 [Dehalococcoidia bacterium]|nr:hypothetical protein [Dehalococcoidia bacterium]
MKARFRVLHFVALASKAIGWLALIAGLALGALIAQGSLRVPLVPFVEPYSGSSLVQGAAVFVPFLMAFLLLYSAGGTVQVLLAIEENTRKESTPPPVERPGDADRPREGDQKQIP